jgi:hypothetical protein
MINTSIYNSKQAIKNFYRHDAPGGSSEEDEEEKEKAREKAKGKGKGPRRFSETEDEFKPEESEEEAAEGEIWMDQISVADPGCLSRIRLFSIPDPRSELSPSRIPDPHQRI